MKAPGIVILLYGFLVLSGGMIGFTIARSIAPLIAGIAGGALGIGLLASGVGVFRGKNLGFMMAPILTLLLATFFGFRFVQSGEIIPSGLMAALGLVAVFLYFALRR